MSRALLNLAAVLAVFAVCAAIYFPTDLDGLSRLIGMAILSLCGAFMAEQIERPSQ